MATETAQGLPEVDAATLKAWLEADDVTLIDVREEAEYAAAHIPGALLMPTSKFQPDAVARAANGRVVVHCASAMRASEACAKLLTCGCENVWLFKPGVKGWREAGYEVAGAGQEKLPVLRQVQLIVGTGIVIGTALGLMLSPWFFTLPAMMGCGLLMAGATGSCPMADALAKLPYNQCSSGKCSR